jgi:membrane protease YdiL (CAAX protease family)
MLAARPSGVQAGRPDPARRGERARDATTHNGTGMRLPGSVSSHPLPVFVALAVTALGVAAMLGGAGFVASQPGLSLRLQIAFGTVLLAVPSLAALALYPPARAAARGAGRVSARTALLSAGLGAALWVGSLGLMEVQSLVVPPPAAYLDAFRLIHAALAPSGVVDALVSFLVIAGLPGSCEELVVRGVLLPALVPWTGRVARFGPGLAVTASALLFAAMHFDPYRFLFTFVIGLVLGALRLATGSLWPSVVAHVSLNTLTFAVAPWLDDPTQPYTPAPALGLACLLAGAAVSWPLLKALRSSVDSPGAAS